MFERRCGYFGLLGAVVFGSVAGGDVFQTVNESIDPAPFFWAAPSGNIRWYWAPVSNVHLSSIQTRLTTGFGNINNDFTFTTTLFSDRPAAGGVELGLFDWNGATPVDEFWLGGEFAQALELVGGTTYLIGMSGLDQGLTGNGGSGINWINWIDPPDQPGGESLVTGSGYTGFDFETQMNTGDERANVDSPILRLIAVPTPASGLVLVFGAVLIARRRPRTMGEVRVVACVTSEVWS
jgi:hypothetical protein